MKALLTTAAAIALLTASTARAEDAAGDWAGVIAGQLHVVIHLTRGADGKLTGMLESVDQGDARLPIDAVEATPDHLHFLVPAAGGSYDGVWTETTKEWTGTWSQGQPIALNLHRATAADAPPKRPQEDAIANAPLPYAAETVSFGTLAGTFTKPQGPGPFPAVVLIAGSGPNNRDEDVFGHKVFLVLADYLTRQGIAVLRYDKRGIGASKGDFGTATTADFITDAEAAAAYLKTRPDVDTKHIGLIGHSEGGLVAPAVAVNDPGVNFVVLMAGTGLRGDAVLKSQGELIARANGASEADIARGGAMRDMAFTVIENATDAADARAKLTAGAAKAVAAGQLKQEDADRNIAQLTSPWMFAFLRYDPIPALTKVRVPVLAIDGSLDLQVEPKANLAAIKLALKNDQDVTITELPGLNHLFQTAKTGSPNEYNGIEETVSPVALKTIGDWVTAHAGKR